MAITSLSAGLAILAGSLTVLSPCVLPVLPVLVGRSLSTHRYGPIALVAGLVGGFATAGSLLGIASSWLAELASTLRFVGIFILLLMGLLAIFPKLSYLLVSYLQLGKIKRTTGVGLTGEFWLGTQLGLLWTPCAGPVLGSILILAAAKHQITEAFLLLLAFGVGAALPLLAIAYAGRYVSKSLLGLRSRSEILHRVGGVLVVASAIAILLGWDVEIQLWLAPMFPRLPL
ncbi:cytochrome c biogenesis protein CcdA [Fortiea sp. LEGE XX443]|uniref:cytochrome c biogenesis CcdA family protein n=1 Tax=Fortiea sp. LEGE XX443 TaxID=1828611 RepID=UPI00187FD9B6|nr:cytochrome c biogenesis CcdA family protein [Fortiea sp. LEGE XX443]MBE9007825.1 cytochrome c biogenesis protein CcdA [Fortiea sp. LEGE XX443]